MCLNFSCNKEQLAIQKMVYDFVESSIIPVRNYGNSGQFLRDTIMKMQKSYLKFIIDPPYFYNTFFDIQTLAVITEELGRGCSEVAQAVFTHHLASLPVIWAGDTKQKNRLFSNAVKSDKLRAFCIGENINMTDLSTIPVEAKRDGEYYILNGVYSRVINGWIADQYTVCATLDRKDNSPAVVFFIVDRTLKGISVKEYDNTTTIVFDKVRIPKRGLVGKEEDGVNIATRIINISRTLLSSIAVGMSQSIYELVRSYVTQRIQSEPPIAAFHTLQLMLVDMSMKLEASQLLVQKATWMLDNNLCSNKASLLARCFSVETCLDIASKAMQILGDYGYTREYPVAEIIHDIENMNFIKETSRIDKNFLAVNFII